MLSRVMRRLLFLTESRTAVPTVLTLMAFALVGCGGDSGAAEAEQAKRVAVQRAEQRRAAEQRWRAGLREWSLSMMQPALGVSGVMTDSLSLVLEGDPATRRRLNSHLADLRRCTKQLAGIGRVPTRFRRARGTAANACARLEAGAALVDLGIEAYQGGLGEGLLSRAATSIGKGVELLGTANNRLPPS